MRLHRWRIDWRWFALPLALLIVPLYLLGMGCIITAAFLAAGPSEAARQWRERP